MTLILIDFEWWKDSAGYALVAARAPRPPRDGESLLAQDHGEPQRIVPKGGKQIPYRPLEKFGELFRVFANIETPEDALRFINDFGPLTQRGLRADRGEDVMRALDHADKFRSWIDLGRRGRRQLAAWIGTEGKQLMELETSLVADKSGAIRLRIVPKSLLSGLWLQLAQTLAGGARIVRCKQCGDWFKAGRGTGRRLDSEYCSDEHRSQYHNLKRPNSAGQVKRLRH